MAKSTLGAANAKTRNASKSTASALEKESAVLDSVGARTARTKKFPSKTTK